MFDKRQLKENTMRCEVADEPVVVKKSRPVKPGNSVEDKTEMTRWLVHLGVSMAKSLTTCEGVK